MCDPPGSGLEPVSHALAGNSYPLNYQEDHTLYFLKDLLEQTAFFLFLCGFLVASCNLCFLQIFQKSHWPALFISLALSPCPGHICLSWSWGHMWCSPHIGDKWREAVRVFRAHPYGLMCRTTYLLIWIRNVCGGFGGFCFAFFFLRWMWLPHFMFLKIHFTKHKETKFPL